MRGPVAEKRSGYLEGLAWRIRDEARERYAAASAKSYAAKLIAGQGPPEGNEPRLTPKQSEELTRLILRGDSFVNARTVLEDLPEDALKDKWVTIHTLVVAADEANEEVMRYKAGLGFNVIK